MKKFGLFLIVLVISLSFVFVMFACSDNLPKMPALQSSIAHLALASGVNYANDVRWDVEKFDELKDQGLYWTKPAKNAQGFEQAMLWEIERDTSHAEYFDPNKPTVIYFHGVQQDRGYHLQVNLSASNTYALPQYFEDFINLEEEGLDGIYLPTIWLMAGFNFGIYHWHRLSDPAAAGLLPIEVGIWSTELMDSNPFNPRKIGIQYRRQKPGTLVNPNHNDTEYINNVSEFSIAEHVAADYIRAMNAFNRVFNGQVGKTEIRFAGHSMGGQLSAASLFLLTQLAKDGQLPLQALPTRYAMLDSYFGLALTDEITARIPEVTINWTNGGGFVNDGDTGATLLEVMRYLVSAGIALEFYITPNFMTAIFTVYSNAAKEIATVYVDLNFENFIYPNFSAAQNAHNALNEWYFLSIAFDYTLTKDNTGAYAPNAALPTNLLRQLEGTEFAAATAQFPPKFAEFNRVQ
jgi:hypothetical protein